MTTPSSRQEITMEKYKTKAIQADLGIFRHIQAYSARHNQEYSDIFRTLCNPEIFRTLTRIQNPGKFRTRRVFRILANSELDAYSEP